MNLKKKTYLLVTGASRGIGQAIAIHMSRKFHYENSVIVLMGRNDLDLSKTKTAIQKATNALTQQSPNIYSFSLELNNAKPNDFKKIIQTSLEIHKANNFERAIIIHNAGTVGDLTQHACNAGDPDVWSNYFNVNFFSTTALNVEFMSFFQEIPKLVVNITTKCAVEPFPSMTYYCVAKAAREMYFRVLAKEEKPEETLVLNYAPGAVDTQMSMKVQDESCNAELAAAFRKQRESNKMLTAEETTNKLISVLESQHFKSGDHVDYWD